MAVSKRLRYEILTRDGHRCRYCGATAPDVKLVIDHVTPTALGGRDEPSNLVTACEPCNSGKTSTVPGAAVVADVANDAVRWAAAMKQAIAEMEAEEEPRLAYRQAFLDAWNEWTITWNGKEEPLPLPEDWRSSVERYRLAGIPATAWPDLIEPGAASRKVRPVDVFRYTCGVANNWVTRLQERTKAIVAPQATKAGIDATWESAFQLVKDAAFTLWAASMTNDDEPLPEVTATEFKDSLAALTDCDLTLEPGRIVNAAQYATYFGLSDIQVAMRDMDADHVCSAWRTSWPTTYVPGDPDEPWSGHFLGGPTGAEIDRVKDQTTKLLQANVPVSRLTWAAAYAGFHKSTRLYRGLADQELAATGTDAFLSQVLENWRVAFAAGDGSDPSQTERDQFFDSLHKATVAYANDRYYLLRTDLLEAASWAGAYQDPDVATCLPLQGSVFAAAAALPALPE